MCDTIDNAIVIRNGQKKFGQNVILKDLNLTVPVGAIYALLGASGSGKTTILNTILDLQTLNEGSVEIFGFPAGSKESGVPGSRIGYQPQELALFQEFTIREIILYFGRIFGMGKAEIEDRLEFLSNLLKLPREKSIIKDLSGGQKRRVSFAVALIQDSEILILDEPTVGLDPLLRQCIWSYLNDLVKKQNKTIIITTHYIEEAEQAHLIGMIRNGRILFEDSPQNLKQKFQSDKLESIVKEICQKDENEVNFSFLPNAIQNPLLVNEKKSWKNDNSSCWSSRMKALVLRNFTKMRRNFTMLLFLALFPGFGVLFSGMAIGKESKFLPIGIVNQDMVKGGICDFDNLTDICSRENISCHFLKNFPQNSLNLKTFENEIEALENVKNGQIFGYISIARNFSTIFPLELEHKMKIFIDTSNQILVLDIMKYIERAYEELMGNWTNSCHYFDTGKSYEKQIIFEEIVGDIDASYSEFVTPAMIVFLMFFIGFSLTALILIQEKNSGMFDRSVVAGVTRIEIIISHFISLGLIIVVQALVSLCVLLHLSGTPCRGSYFLVLSLAVTEGVLGILCGFVLSSICKSEFAAFQITMTISAPFFIISGFWPVESIPSFMKFMIWCTPLSLTSNSLQSIINRGHGIWHKSVWTGFLSINVWIIGIIVILYILNRKSSKK